MLASYRGLVEWTIHCTVALGNYLDRFALSECGSGGSTRFLTAFGMTTALLGKKKSGAAKSTEQIQIQINHHNNIKIN